MRVCFLTPMIAPYRVSFYEKLQSHHEIDLVVIHGQKKSNDGRPAFQGELQFTNISVARKSLNLFGVTLSHYNSIMKSIRIGDFDAIVLEASPSVLSNWYILLYGKLAGIKVFLWVCGWEPDHNTLVRELSRIMKKVFFRLGYRFVCYSTKSREFLLRHGVDPNKVSIAYNGIETDPYRNSSDLVLSKGSLLRFNIPKQSKIFLYVGGIFEGKRVDLLVKAFAKVKLVHQDIKLWIIGDGPELPTISTLVQALKVQDVQFLGRIEEGVEKYFYAADFFILPGIGGLALNHAMLWETPCIVSSADGTEQDLVMDGVTGFRFVKDDLNSLIDTMELSLKMDVHDLNLMRQRGKSLILDRSNVNEMVRVFTEELQK